MKFYVLEVENTTTGTAKQITEYDNERLAIMALHQVLASAMANESVNHVLCMVVNEVGAVVKNEYH
jgi:hypothetical protein